MLEVSLSLSLRRRFLVLWTPEELRLLEAVAPEQSKRLEWVWPEPEVRVTITLAAVPGDRLNLGEDGRGGLDDG